MMADIAPTATDIPAKAERAAESARGTRIYRPLTDIAEAPDGVTMTLEMPGVAADDVEIALEKRVLTIKGRARLTNAEAFELAYAEYGEGDYQRVFTLSEDLDGARIAATMRDGVLTLTLPRAEAARPQRIKVAAR